MARSRSQTVKAEVRQYSGWRWEGNDAEVVQGWRYSRSLGSDRTSRSCWRCVRMRRTEVVDRLDIVLLSVIVVHFDEAKWSL